METPQAGNSTVTDKKLWTLSRFVTGAWWRIVTPMGPRLFNVTGRREAMRQAHLLRLTVDKEYATKHGKKVAP